MYKDNKMDKPTIFFSHSSKDGNLVLPIKERIISITGGTIDIFQSSDGQSIPLGRNWIHKIEDGLNKASIMFVFVTPNSIVSNWIYFEAGFAYSKDIRVIPVGLGIDIALLKAPLNLLQGFNITSSDSLNNFISVLNDTYQFNFLGQFTNDDYVLLDSFEKGDKSHKEYSAIFKSITYDLASNYEYSNGDEFYDIKAFFNGILDFLQEQGIQYSISERLIHNVSENTKITDSYTVLVQGIKISYKVGTEDKTKQKNDNAKSRIKFEISPYNFEPSFNLFISLAKLCKDIKWTVLKFNLLSNYEYLTAEADISAVLFSNLDLFVLPKDNVGSFSLKGENIHFWINQKIGSDMRKGVYELGVSFKPNEVKYRQVVLILDALIEKSIIKALI